MSAADPLVLPGRELSMCYTRDTHIYPSQKMSNDAVHKSAIQLSV